MFFSTVLFVSKILSANTKPVFLSTSFATKLMSFVRLYFNALVLFRSVSLEVMMCVFNMLRSVVSVNDDLSTPNTDLTTDIVVVVLHLLILIFTLVVVKKSDNTLMLLFSSSLLAIVS